MALAETAKMIASLEMTDKFTPVINRAIGGVTKLQTKFNKASMGASASFAAMGGTVSKGAKNLVSNLSRIGVAAAASLGVFGVFSIGGAFQQAISKVQSFGEAVDKTMSLTGLSAEKASSLSSALAYVGVNGDAAVKMLGMAEKNLGIYTATADKATAFQKQFGLSLTDSNGKAVDANELLLRSADLYTNKNIPAATKALALSKIYGRAWTQNIEVFELGRKKIAQAESEMAAFGLTMTPQNLKDWEKFRDVSRQTGGAIAGLELQLGLLVMPDLVSGMKTFVEFVRTHQSDIKRFFNDGLKAAKEIGAFVTGTLFPVLSSIAGVAKTIWGSIPAPMQQFLVGGFVMNKLTGGAVNDLVKQLASGLIKGVLGINAGVVNVNAATVTGVGAGAADVITKAGGVGALTALGVALIPALVGTAVFATLKFLNVGDINASQTGMGPATHGFQNTSPGIVGPHGYIPLPGSTTGTGTLRPNMAGLPTPADLRRAAMEGTARGAERGVADGLIHSNLFGKAATAREATGSKFSFQVLEKFLKGDKAVTPMQAFVTGQAVTLQAINKLRTPGNEAADLKGARGELRELKGIQARFLASGDTAMANKIGADIRSLEAAVKETTRAVNALPGKIKLGTVIVRLTNAAGATASAIIGTGKGASHGALEYAGGLLATVAGATRMIVGEAGRETVAILRNPRPAMLPAAHPQPVTVSLNVRTSIDSRQNDRGTSLQRRYGPTPTRAGAW